MYSPNRFLLLGWWSCHRYKKLNRAMDRLKTACIDTCRCFFRVLFWVPVVFVTVIVAWAYYVYVFVLNLLAPVDVRKPIPIIVLLLLIAHVLLFLQISSYFRTIFSKHKQVPNPFIPTDDQLDRMDDMVDSQPYLRELSHDLPVYTVTKTGGVRYCSVCEVIKPDRCHHCSTCNRCILKMDHHCPWVNNCVGYSNYKYFVLFLLYTVLLCLWFSLSSLYDFVQIWQHPSHTEDVSKKFNVTFCYLIVTVFSFSTGMLLIFHFYLIAVNRTTIENMDQPRLSSGATKNLYHLGLRRNFQSVFGRNILLAILPIATSTGNGSSFPMRYTQPDAAIHMRRRENGNSDEQEEECEETRADNIENGHIVAHASPSDSEVEIFAVEDDSERQPLTAYTHTT